MRIINTVKHDSSEHAYNEFTFTAKWNSFPVVLKQNYDELIGYDKLHL